MILVTVTLLSIGQLLLKYGVQLTPVKFELVSLFHTLFSPFVMLGFFFYGLASVLGIYVIQKLPLSIAIPSMSLAYIVILFASAYFFGEKITSIKIVGIALIILGVFVLSKSA